MMGKPLPFEKNKTATEPLFVSTEQMGQTFNNAQEQGSFVILYNKKFAIVTGLKVRNMR